MVKKYSQYIHKYYPAWGSAQAAASISLKPMAIALVFLFVFGYAQACGLMAKPAKYCSEASKISILALAYQLPNQVINLGARSLEITNHAAERMSERQVSVAEIEELVMKGKLFAYLDNRLVKIGYFDKNTGLFAAVDQRHKKLITVIRKTDPGYPERLMVREIVEHSRRV